MGDAPRHRGDHLLDLIFGEDWNKFGHDGILLFMTRSQRRLSGHRGAARL
jgi:hypothetical protein